MKVCTQCGTTLIKDENAKPYNIGGLGGTGKFEIPEDRNLISRYIARDIIQATEGVLFGIRGKKPNLRNR